MLATQSKASQELLEEVFLLELSQEEMQQMSGGLLFRSLSDVAPISLDLPLFNFFLASITEYTF